MDKSEISSIILAFIHAETGWGDPLRPYCEFEDLFFDEIENIGEDRVRAVFRYHFDEDGFSQYDKTHILEGEAIIDNTGTIVASKLRETYTGPATVNDPYKPQ